MRQLKAFSTLNHPDRNSAIDVFRGIAIILVVLSHFDKIIPMGNTGVGLFFVISGFLVGGILTKELQTNGTVNYFRFFFFRELLRFGPPTIHLYSLEHFCQYYFSPNQIPIRSLGFPTLKDTSSSTRITLGNLITGPLTTFGLFV